MSSDSEAEAEAEVEADVRVEVDADAFSDGISLNSTRLDSPTRPMSWRSDTIAWVLMETSGKLDRWPCVVR